MDILNESASEVPLLLQQLREERRVVGVKQLRKALQEGRARRVFLAKNADPQLTKPVELLCGQKEVPCTWVATMADLGNACGIDVGAAAAAVVSDSE